MAACSGKGVQAKGRRSRGHCLSGSGWPPPVASWRSWPRQTPRLRPPGAGPQRAPGASGSPAGVLLTLGLPHQLISDSRCPLTSDIISDLREGEGEGCPQPPRPSPPLSILTFGRARVPGRPLFTSRRLKGSQQ